MKQTAFFYNGHYYLLPDDCESVDDLNLRHRDGKPIQVTELCEKKCMAPYFVSEHVKVKSLKLKKKADESPAFPVAVEVMTQKEYNQRLREMIPSHCLKCESFSELDETDESLEGHHEEISLDGVCLTCQAIKDKYGDFKAVNRWFRFAVKNFARLDLARLVDEGKTDDAARIFTENVCGFAYGPTPAVWADKQKNGRYRIVATHWLDEESAILLDWLFCDLTKKYGKTWDFCAGIPQGYMRPDAVKPLGILLEQQDGPRPYVNLTVFAAPQAQEDAPVCAEEAAYLWMAGTYDERYLQQNCMYISVEVPDGKLPKGVMAADDVTFATVIEQNAAADAITDNPADLFPSVHLLFDFDSEMPEEPTEEEFFSHITFDMTRCRKTAMQFAMPVSYGEVPTEPAELSPMLADMRLPIGRIVLSVSGEDFPQICAKDILPVQEIGSIVERLYDDKLVIRFAQRLSKCKLEFWFYILNLEEFLYAVRRNAPVYQQYPYDLYIYTASGKNGGHYKPDYSMKRKESEPALRKKWKIAEPGND